MIATNLAFLEALGISVVPVERLKKEVALVRNLDVGLVRADLPRERHERALEWLIQEAAGR